MRLTRQRSRRRSFHEVLEDLPPARRFLWAANPPPRAGAEDVRYLADKSFSLRYSDIPGTYHYARLACTLGRALTKDDADLQDAKGAAWTQFGAILRVLGHLPSSLSAFATAEEELAKGSSRPDHQARLWEWRGSLYRDWRKFELAEKCLTTAIHWHSQADQLADWSRCLVSRALCAGKGGDPARAVRLAERALKRIDGRARPDLAASALHTLCWNLVDAGQPSLALTAYVEGESLFEAQPAELVQVHRSWLLAHIGNALGHYSRAEGCYWVAAAVFSKHELGYERALVLLDLCLPLAAQQRLEELSVVAAEILPEFERIGISREATASRLLLSAATQATVAERVKGSSAGLPPSSAGASTRPQVARALGLAPQLGPWFPLVGASRKSHQIERSSPLSTSASLDR